MRTIAILLLACGLMHAQAANALLTALIDAPNTPADSPGAGTYSSTQSVTLTDASAQFINYTTDGSTPACPSTGTLYTGAFNISVTTTLKAIGCNGVTGGGVLTSVYTISATTVTQLGTFGHDSSSSGLTQSLAVASGSRLIVAANAVAGMTATWNSLSLNSDVSVAYTGASCYLMSLYVASGATANLVISYSGNHTIQIAALSVTSVQTGLDKTSSGTGSATSPTSGATATTAQANEFLMGSVCNAAVGSIGGTWSNSFSADQTACQTTALCIGTGYNTVSSTGAYTAAKTGITSSNWGALIATYKIP